MHSSTAGGSLPLGRRVTAVLALTSLAWLTASTVTPANGHAAPAVLAPLATGAVRLVATSGMVDTVADLFVNSSVGDVNYYQYGNGGPGTPTYTGGGGDGGGNGSYSAKQTTRKGKYGEIIAGLFGAGAFAFDWAFKEGQSSGYADPVANTAAYGWTYGPKNGVTQSVTSHTLPANGATVNYNRLSGNTYRGFSFRQTNGVVASGGGFTSTTGATSYAFPSTDAPMAFWLCSGSSSCYNNGTDVVTDPANLAALWRRTQYDTDLAAAPAPPTPGTTPVTTTTTTQCSGGGSSQQVITYTGGSTDLPKITGQCPAGQTITGISQTSTAGGQTVPSPMGNITAPVVPSGYPQCQPLGACQLVLTQHAPGTGAQIATCNQTGACFGWAAQPRSAPTQTTTTTTGATATTQTRAHPDGRYYECRYGPYLIDVDGCAYVPTEPNTDDDLDQEAFCDFQLSKPWTWPLQALKCAFIPRQAVVQEVTGDLMDAWATTPPGVVAGGVSDVLDPLTGLKDAPAQDCAGPTIAFDVPTGQNFSFQPLNACSNLAQYVLGIAMPLVAAFVYIAGFAAGARILSRTIGMDSAVPA